jgi:hypothetical protein
LKWAERLVPVLLAIVILESAFIALPLLNLGSANNGLVPGKARSLDYQYTLFNQPISNDTESQFSPSYDGSWLVTFRSTLRAESGKTTEAQLALAPEFPKENLSIPTIIVQERADGLVRVEYFAQDWVNTYGLILWNSTSPSWNGGQNLTLRFVRFGPPSVINPQLAPRPNGNLTIMLGNTVLLLDYPIAWASLASVYVYGLSGSSFTGGTIHADFWSLT